MASSLAAPISGLYRPARLAVGLLWLLSAMSAFGQDRLLISPIAREPLAHSKPFHVPASQDKFSSRFSPLAFRLSPSHLMPPPVSAEKLGLPSALDRTPPQPSGGQRAYARAIEPVRSGESGGFHWGSALSQSLLFLGIEQSVRLAFDPPSRTATKGKFWKDYVDSLHELGHWGDGNPMFINYVGHPLQGSIAGFIQIQNDPVGRMVPFSWSRQYRNSRLKALAWSTAYSTYFEIGFPLSEAAMGNLGVDKHRRTQQGLVDIVITPTLGLCWLMTEDFADRYLVGRYERGHPGKKGRALVRTFLNPTRAFSNLLRFKVPWYRDGRP